jgi:hypothetical protein
MAGEAVRETVGVEGGEGKEPEEPERVREETEETRGREEVEAVREVVAAGAGTLTGGRGLRRWRKGFAITCRTASFVAERSFAEGTASRRGRPIFAIYSEQLCAQKMRPQTVLSHSLRTNYTHI